MSELLSAFKKIATIVTSKRCKLCGTVIEFNSVYCDDCISPPSIAGPVCTYCGYSKDDCICKKHKNEYKQIVAPYYYEKGIISAVHNFKDNDMPFLAKSMAGDMLQSFNEYYSDIEFDYISYVPLHYFKEFKRGFNQSKLLANELSLATGIPVLNSLVKTRNTGTQHYKTAEERKADAFGSYDVKDKCKSQIINKKILLIDDVKTTGSTINECAKMLNIYGADSVYAVSFAITKKEKHSTK